MWRAGECLGISLARIVLQVLAAILLLTICSLASATAQIGALGVMGDSLSDEYFARNASMVGQHYVR
jgi:hypothetical protein